jgi:hypothetical protein
VSSAAVKAEDAKREGSEMHFYSCIFTVSRWCFCGVARRVSRSRPSAPLHLYCALSWTQGRQVQADDVALGSDPLSELQFPHFAHPQRRDQRSVHLQQCVIRRFQPMVYKSTPMHTQLSPCVHSSNQYKCNSYQHQEVSPGRAAQCSQTPQDDPWAMLAVPPLPPPHR